jgi:hypothetical protein
MKLTKAQQFLLDELAKDGTHFFAPGVGEKTYCLFPAGCDGLYPGKRFRECTIWPLYKAGLIKDAGWPSRPRLTTPEERAKLNATD